MPWPSFLKLVTLPFLRLTAFIGSIIFSLDPTLWHLSKLTIGSWQFLPKRDKTLISKAIKCTFQWIYPAYQDYSFGLHSPFLDYGFPIIIMLSLLHAALISWYIHCLESVHDHCQCIWPMLAVSAAKTDSNYFLCLVSSHRLSHIFLNIRGILTYFFILLIPSKRRPSWNI